MTHSNDIMMKPVGFIHSPYNDKFAVPRQPRLAPSAVCVLEFYPPYDTENAFEGIDGFSHLHLIFLFDRVCYEEFKPRVRPPRLGGNTYVGVFATRSPFRPNRIGMSIVKLERVIRQKGRVKLVISGADLVDGTPVLDIKPYIPLKNQDVSKETQSILALIYESYFATDEEKRQIFKERNEQINLKYNADNLFKNKDYKNEKHELIVVKKQSFFEKIINKIKLFFHE